MPKTVASPNGGPVHDPQTFHHIFECQVPRFEVATNKACIKAICKGNIVQQFDPEYLHLTTVQELREILQPHVNWETDVVKVYVFENATPISPFYLEKRGRIVWVDFDMSETMGPASAEHKHVFKLVDFSMPDPQRQKRCQN